MSASREDRMIALWAATIAVPVVAIGREYLSTNQQLVVAGVCVAVLAVLILVTAIVGRHRNADGRK